MLTLNNYLKKKILILGIGITGLSCIHFFCMRNIPIRIMDFSIFPKNINKLPKFVPCHTGSVNYKWILESELIIVSPGCSLNHPSLILAKKKGIEIIGDIELFCREAKAPIIAITGSNGKSTVSTIIKKMIEKSGKKVQLGGNIGVPALLLLNKVTDFYILELSSFQLETIFNLHAKIAVILNISEDHMDRYPFGINDYVKSKLNIYTNAKTCVWNAEDKLTTPTSVQEKEKITFGIHNGDYHLLKEGKEIWLSCQSKKIFNTKNMILSGTHNYINALASLLISDKIGLPRENSLQFLECFSGLPHCFQLIHEKKGIKWIDDSKATNVNSTLAALKTLQEQNISGIIWLLLGGDGKNSDFSPLKYYLKNMNIRAYCYGKDKFNLYKIYSKKSILVNSLKESLILITKKMKSGDIILLSPACSSLDQFSSFKERGNLFKKLSKELG